MRKRPLCSLHDLGREGLVGNAVILNDYETFAEKVYHTVLAL